MPIINHLNLANTWNDWLTGTQQLIEFANNFTQNTSMVSLYNGTSPFIVNNDLRVDGDLTVNGSVDLDVSTDYDNLNISGNLILSASNTAGDKVGPFFEVANTATTGASRYQILGNGLAYTFDIDAGGNPDLYLEPGQTYAFDLQQLNGAHPFVIRTTDSGSTSDGGTYYNVGLTHIEITSGGNDVITSKGFEAQGKNKGILYWKVPANTVGGIYYYQCTSHAVMKGTIYIENSNRAAFAKANSIADATAFAIGLG